MNEIKIVNNKRKKIAIIVFSVFVLISVLTLYFYLNYNATHITTDDAFVEGNIHTIASKVNGTVKMIYVKDNQSVKKGELLLEIDPVDYDVRVKEAAAILDAEKKKLLQSEIMIEASKKKLAEMNAYIEVARANLQLQDANIKQAEKDIKRAENLFKKDAISKERYEKTKTIYDVVTAQLKAAKEQLRQAEIAAETQKTAIKQAEVEKAILISSVRQKEALLDAAKLNYEYTKIYAPDDGYITKKSVEVGNQIKQGQPLMAVVPLRDVYVIANYKETQLQKIKPGQKVKIRVDTYPGRIFWGRVESIMAGTGAVFSLFPPENATGQFVKVVQRIPVKIVFDKDTDSEHVLRVGMSVVPTVIVEK
ncbi:RND transporter [Dissulfurispira thermophila]|uniref:RND transporter n=1 Tax=Dissulfurispira thermophila TaxID=2715679 RepID=A0A7G1H3L1_9BACT|nr:HlyD family secretion protein [Dissulfurispira thermophila]BCB96741.1 RND transporter [Dissulfurispira thermophila]